MMYNEWEDRGMYAPPMFSMIESGETKEDRIIKAASILGDFSKFEKEMRITCEKYPNSAADHINPAKGEVWLITATLYRLGGFSYSEFHTIRAECLSDRGFERLYAIAERVMEDWLSEHPSD